MTQRTIVAIEIASSKIKGGLATIGPDGLVTVTAVEEIPAINNVRYGRVQNVREVSAAVNEIIRRLGNHPDVAPRHINSVVVALGGRSVKGVPASASMRFHNECEITEELVQRLKFEATRDYVGDSRVEKIVPRFFQVNNTTVRNVVGNFGETLRGEFMMITCGKETRQKLDLIKYDKIDVQNVKYLMRPLVVADLVMTPDEKELGGVLIDFGAETTTISIYKEGSLVFLTTLPMGSRLITLDLTSGLGVTEEMAESLKKTLGANNGSSAGASGNAEEAVLYARARASEIIANIVNQIKLAGYDAEKLSSIVLTGGGARLPEFVSKLANRAGIPVRVAEMPRNIAFKVAGRNNAENIDIVALLVGASRFPTIDCVAGDPEPEIVIPEVKTVAEPVLDDIDTTVAPAAAPANDEDDEPEKETTRRETNERYDEPKVARGKTRKYDPDEDDDLLADDEDDEDEAPAKRPFGIFSIFGGRKKAKEKAFKDEDDEDDEIEAIVDAQIPVDNDPVIDYKPEFGKDRPAPEEDDDDLQDDEDDEPYNDEPAAEEEDDDNESQPSGAEVRSKIEDLKTKLFNMFSETEDKYD